MTLSFWWRSLELFRELLRWIEFGGANEAALSRFCEELLRELPRRRLAAECHVSHMDVTLY